MRRSVRWTSLYAGVPRMGLAATVTCSLALGTSASLPEKTQVMAALISTDETPVKVVRALDCT